MVEYVAPMVHLKLFATNSLQRFSPAFRCYRANPSGLTGIRNLREDRCQTLQCRDQRNILRELNSILPLHCGLPLLRREPGFCSQKILCSSPENGSSRCFFMHSVTQQRDKHIFDNFVYTRTIWLFRPPPADHRPCVQAQ
jgi:hypothetical protein